LLDLFKRVQNTLNIEPAEASLAAAGNSSPTELTMKAALVDQAGHAPVHADFADPSPAPGLRVLRVTAAAISHVTKSRASGAHYSVDGGGPQVPGLDGVGVDEDGRRVYFILPEAPFGAMAERCLVDARRCIALPDELGDVDAAALALPAMSSWAAFLERARLAPGETVLINGATGASGRLAVQIAKHLGAKKVIATGRNTAVLDELRALGADVTIALGGDRDALETAFKKAFRQGVDVVLDYVWGPSAEALIVAAAKAGPEAVPIRYVQVGAISGADITLPGAALRSSALQLMGSGIGSIPQPRLLAAIRGVLEAAPRVGLRIATRVLPLAQVSQAWEAGDARSRVVLVP
jgi:NADPH:quinone reductase-like Zn-dependent oxidoreductase